MSRFPIVLLSSVILAVTGCASVPSGPGIMVLPGAGISFDRFRSDDYLCQQFSSAQVGGTTPNEAAINSGLISAAVGTVAGAALGAAIGGGRGAAIGASSGLVAGSLMGTRPASSSMYELQHRYDIAYIQCMYAKGHQVPVSGQFSGATSQPSVINRTNNANIPPPPVGSPPPPPPR